MRLEGWLSALFIIVGFNLAGCGAVRHQDVPAHDVVLVYDLPYDLTYLRTLEAVEKVPHWELEETEKEKGIIRARNMNYSNLADADKRSATVLVKRVNRHQTSVALAEHSQRVAGGSEILGMIDHYLSLEMDKR